MGKQAKKPLVSIVTPVYNSSKFLAETIKTVQDQTFIDWEWILIDDKSNDDSLKLIKEAQNNKKIKVIALKNNSGAAKARNAGIAKARGKYLAFLDADDLWRPEKLQSQVEFMQQKNSAFSFTGYQFADSLGKPTGAIVNVPKMLNYEQALKNTIIFTSTVMVDLEKIDKKTTYMPNIPSEDTATWWKILKQISNADGLQRNLSYYRRAKKTLSSNKIKAIWRTWNLYREQEKLNFKSSCYYFSCYIINALIRRV